MDTKGLLLFGPFGFALAITEDSMPIKKIMLSDGSTVIITIDDEGEEIHAEIDDGKTGTITLNHNFDYGDYYHLMNLSFEKIKRRGIGRECIKFHKDCFVTPIKATPHDGFQRDDGSHLTGEGLPFVIAMQKCGLIEKFPDENEDCEIS